MSFKLLFISVLCFSLPDDRISLYYNKALVLLQLVPAVICFVSVLLLLFLRVSKKKFLSLDSISQIHGEGKGFQPAGKLCVTD